MYQTAAFMHGDSCLWFGFLEESFLNPVKWLDEVEAGGAGEDSPGSGGHDVCGLGAAAGREEAEEAGARRRESHRRRKSRFTRRVSSPLSFFLSSCNDESTAGFFAKGHIILNWWKITTTPPALLREHRRNKRYNNVHPYNQGAGHRRSTRPPETEVVHLPCRDMAPNIG